MHTLHASKPRVGAWVSLVVISSKVSCAFRVHLKLEPLITLIIGALMVPKFLCECSVFLCELFLRSWEGLKG